MAEAEQAPILIIDDDEDQRRALCMLLQSRGYAVVMRDGGASALEYLGKGGRARLLILDLSMPGVSGVQVHAELQRNPTLAEIPVIVLSGVAQFAALPNVVAHVRKGVDPEELLRIVAATTGASPHRPSDTQTDGLSWPYLLVTRSC